MPKGRPEGLGTAVRGLGRGFFWRAPLRERRALPSFLIPSISKAPHHGSAQDACVARRSAFLNLRLRPAKGAVGDYARRFLCRGNASSSCAASQSLHIHSIGLAPWHQFRCMCCRAFCVPKFEFGGPPRERWATMRGIFCAIEIPELPALSCMLITKTWSPHRQEYWLSARKTPSIERYFS